MFSSSLFVWQSDNVSSANPLGETTAYSGYDEKVYCKLTLENEFSDELILAVLTREATLRFKAYTAEDFPEIPNVRVEEITEGSAAIVKRQLEAGVVEDRHMINVAGYKRILKLTLEEKGKENVLSVIKQLERRNDIISAEPSFSGGSVNAYPSEYHNLTSTQTWAIDRIDLPYAWDITTGSSSVTVAVVDTGINSTHPEFSGRISSSIPSTDYVGSNALTDPNGHGTHVAGTIGAAANNGGMAGVAWDVRLVSIRILDQYGGSLYYTSHLTSAVEYAAAKGIQIINHSGGSYNITNSEVNAFTTALRNYKGLFVCAAGNDAANNDNNNFFPSNVREPNLISVGATNVNDTIATSADWVSQTGGSNYGANTVDIFAPGTDIYSSLPYGVNPSGYAYRNGTSMAAPHVAGVAALILSKYPGLMGASVKTIIMKGIDPIASLNGLCISGGRLNAYNSLCLVKELNTPSDVSKIRNDPNGTYTLGKSIDLSYINWSPIPYLGQDGLLDGRDFTLYNLSMYNHAPGIHTDIGLFAVNYGMIANIRFTGARISFDPLHTNGWSNAGTICGVNEGSGIIKDVLITDSIIHSVRYCSSIGGITGTNKGIIDNSWFRFSSFYGNGDVGGIAGRNIGGQIIGTVVEGSYIGHEHVILNRSVGGMVGSNFGGGILYCRIYDSTVANLGVSQSNGVDPNYGKIVGLLESNSKVWYVQASNTQMNSGHLTGSQLAFFGTAPIIGSTPAQWCGRIMGTGHDIR